MAVYTNSFETLVEKEVVIDDKSTLKIKLDKNKRNDSLKVHIREFVTTPEYTGFAGKNGVSFTIESADQIDDVRTTLLGFFREVEEIL